MPEERYIALQGMRRENLDLPPPVQVLSVRGPGLSSHIDPKKLRGETISEELAATFDMRAEDLPAPMVSDCRVPVAVASVVRPPRLCTPASSVCDR